MLECWNAQDTPSMKNPLAQYGSNLAVENSGPPLAMLVIAEVRRPQSESQGSTGLRGQAHVAAPESISGRAHSRIREPG